MTPDEIRDFSEFFLTPEQIEESKEFERKKRWEFRFHRMVDNHSWDIPRDVRLAVLMRSNDICEWCGLPINGGSNIHHRWYPDEDTPENLMLVHRACHENIHFGKPIKATKQSLAASADTGKKSSKQWREYLRK